MEAKSIDVNSTKDEVKKCPKAVRDYVTALERRCESKQKLVDDAISELRKARRQVKEPDSLPCVSESKSFDIHNCINDIEGAIEAKVNLAGWFFKRGSIRFQIKRAIDKMLYSR